MMHLISNKLVEFVTKNSDIIIKDWTNRIMDDSSTSQYTKDNMAYFKKKANYILKHLSQWVSYDTPLEEVEKRYTAEGKELFDKGIPLYEIFRSTVLLRRILWLLVVNESGFDSTFQMHQMRELNDRVILFFDRAHYYRTRGYMEEMNKKMKELWNLTDADTDKVLFHDYSFNK